MITSSGKKQNIITAALLVLSMLSVFVFSGCSNNGDPVNKNNNDADILARVVLCNDVEFGNRNDGIAEIMVRRMFCQSIDKYGKIDAFIFVGDLTLAGRKNQFEELFSLVDSIPKGDAKVIYTFGANDYCGKLKSCSSIEREFDSVKGNTDTEINGIHFIGLSSYDLFGYNYDTKWLSEHMAAASKETPNAPIITFQHYTVSDTIFRRYEIGTQPLYEIFAEYPQTVNFAGHSDFPVTHPWNIDQNDFTAVGLGTVSSYVHLPDTNTISVGVQNKHLQLNESHNFVVVEVMKDYSVRITPHCIETNSRFRLRSGDFLSYTIKDPGNKESFEYTSDKIAAKDEQIPYFSEDSKIDIDNIIGNTCAFTFTPASDDTGINYYKIKIIGVQKEQGSGGNDPDDENYINYDLNRELYWVGEPVSSYAISISGLTKGNDYIIRVYAVDFGERESEPLTYSYRHSQPPKQK